VQTNKIKRRAKRFTWYWFGPILPAAVLILLVIVADRLAIFKIRNVDCQLNHYVCPLNLEPILLSFVGQNIFRFNTASATNQLVAFDPTLSEVVIKKKLPNELEIRLERRLPIASIKIADEISFPGLNSSESGKLEVTLSDRQYYIDKTGFVYQPAVAPSQNLPQVDWPRSLPLVEGESAPVANLAQLINTLSAYYVSYTEIARLPNEPVFVVVTGNGALALVADAQEFAAPIASLQFILSNIKMGESSPLKIDLRFDKPVLTY
jgi:cell division septal protein FtsQ